MAAVVQVPAQTTTIDPQVNPVAYLKAAGWRCLGSETSSTARCWYDPTKPRTDKWEKVEVVAASQWGKLGPVHVKNSDGETVRAVQDKFIAKCEPVSRDDALQTQLLRQEEAEIKAEAERAEAANRAETMRQGAK